MKYLDPKADLTFKKIFGEHKDLLISLLNALLPLSADGQVESVEYLTPELVKNFYLGRSYTISVRCCDGRGRQFFVEVRMLWTEAFKRRVLFDESKAFIRKIGGKQACPLLKPVYSLNLVGETFMKGYPDEFIHNFNIVHDLHNEQIIEGLHLTFIELPKFKPFSIMEKKMAVLWLQFLTQIDENTKEVPQDLLENPETSKALQTVEESSMSKEELFAYEDFWDKMNAERLLFSDSNKRSRNEGIAEGIAQGITQVARNLLTMGMSEADIVKATGLTLADIEGLKG